MNIFFVFLYEDNVFLLIKRSQILDWIIFSLIIQAFI